ncbi:MAG: ABC transporter ATP-binding protein, partial [Hyphomonas sp.]|nr:ABC transporter ATP-binding protein [Hyphomonas sp.]
MIAFTSVSANMGEQPALRDVSVEAGAGEVVALTGPNGAGKSTLLKVAAGLITPAAGDVLVGGALLTDMPYAERARHIAWLPQVRPVAWNLFAEDLVALGLGVRSANGYDRLAPAGRQRVDAA